MGIVNDRVRTGTLSSSYDAPLTLSAKQGSVSEVFVKHSRHHASRKILRSLFLWVRLLLPRLLSFSLFARATWHGAPLFLHGLTRLPTSKRRRVETLCALQLSQQACRLCCKGAACVFVPSALAGSPCFQEICIQHALHTAKH